MELGHPVLVLQTNQAYSIKEKVGNLFGKWLPIAYFQPIAARFCKMERAGMGDDLGIAMRRFAFQIRLVFFQIGNQCLPTSARERWRCSSTEKKSEHKERPKGNLRALFIW